MIIYQLFLILVAVAAGIHGVAECNFTGQLDEHYLEGAYLDQNGAFFIRGNNVAQIKKNDPNDGENEKIRDVDVIRIDKEKFALLGFRMKNEAHRLKKLLVIEDGEVKIDKSYTHEERLQNKDKAYYDKGRNAIFIGEKHEISLRAEGELLVGNGNGNKTCFKDDIRCVYDPYTQQLKIDNSSNHATFQLLSTSSCNLNVMVYTGKAYLSDRTGYKVCLGPSDDYHKIFLFPDLTMYDENCTDIVALSKTPRTTKAPFKPAYQGNQAINAAVNEDAMAGDNCDEDEYNAMWGGAGAAIGVAVLLLIAGLIMIVIERRGKGRKQAYMRLQKMYKKDEQPSAYTTITQTNLDTQDDGATKTQDDAAKDNTPMLNGKQK